MMKRKLTERILDAPESRCQYTYLKIHATGEEESEDGLRDEKREIRGFRLINESDLPYTQAKGSFWRRILDVLGKSQW